MTDIEPSPERSTKICRLGSTLSKSPECVGIWRSPGDKFANWQIGKSQTEGFAYGFAYGF